MADQRDDSNSKEHLRSILEDLRSDPDALIEIILQQAERIDALQSKMDRAVEQMQGQIDRLQKRVRELNEENRRLREERDEVERAGKRQAAPFRVEEEKRSDDPSQPGREEGHKAGNPRFPLPPRTGAGR
jgi:predicted transcriptional regulator